MLVHMHTYIVIVSVGVVTEITLDQFCFVCAHRWAFKLDSHLNCCPHFGLKHKNSWCTLWWNLHWLLNVNICPQSLHSYIISIWLYNCVLPWSLVSWKYTYSKDMGLADDYQDNVGCIPCMCLVSYHTHNNWISSGACCDTSSDSSLSQILSFYCLYRCLFHCQIQVHLHLFSSLCQWLVWV